MEREPDAELTAELRDLIRRGADREERAVLLDMADVDEATHPSTTTEEELSMRVRKGTASGSRLQRVQFWLSDAMYDYLRQEWDGDRDPLSWRVAERIEHGALWVLCKLYGHEPIRDHCGMPEHDYCAGCGRSTPNMAARR